MNQATDDGVTSLFVASQNGHLELSTFLVAEGGAAVNQATTDDGCTPLFSASQNGHLEVAKLLVAEGGAAVNQARTTTGAHRSASPP